jgi:hypothetical protein
MWSMIYCVVWNYPEQNPKPETIENVRSFLTTLFQIVQKTEMGNKILNLLQRQYPLDTKVLSGRNTLINWTYNIRVGCNSICGPVMPLKDLDTFMEAFRARNHDCKDDSQKSELQKLAELNEPLGCK